MSRGDRGLGVLMVATRWSVGYRTLGALAVFAIGFGMPASGWAQEHRPLSSWLPRLSSYAQIRYTEHDPGRDAWGLRRSKLIFDGGHSGKARYHVQVIYKHNNGSRTDDTLYVQDAYFAFHAGKVGWTIGQFKPPFGLERFEPDARLYFVDRTEATNRLIVNGKLGQSFARDRGVQMDVGWKAWRLSAGVFAGGGANQNQKSNGPLGVVRLQWKRRGAWRGHRWFVRVGGAGSTRHADDLDLSHALKGVPKLWVKHFAGDDRRMNLFAEGKLGRFIGQAEVFRAWLNPDSGVSWKAQGAYGQLVVLPAKGVSLALRNAWMTPDADTPVPAVHNWTVAAAYDFRNIPLRLITDYAWYVGDSSSMSHVWRFQIQYVFAKGMPLTH